jgi:hypothetical protein
MAMLSEEVRQTIILALQRDGSQQAKYRPPGWEQEVERIEAALSAVMALDVWQPVEDGYRWRGPNKEMIDWWRDHLIVGLASNSYGIVPPDNIRLCRLVQQTPREADHETA